MARRRVMEIGPSVNTRGAATKRITVDTLRQDIRKGGTSRIRLDPNAVVSKSQLRRKIVKGIRPPGYQPPNYPSPNY